MAKKRSILALMILLPACGRSHHNKEEQQGTSIEPVQSRLGRGNDSGGVVPIEAFVVKTEDYRFGLVTVTVKNLTDKSTICVEPYQSFIGTKTVQMNFATIKIPGSKGTRTHRLYSCLQPGEIGYVSGELREEVENLGDEILVVNLGRNYNNESFLPEKAIDLVKDHDSYGLTIANQKIDQNILIFDVLNDSDSGRFLTKSEPSVLVTDSVSKAVMLLRGIFANSESSEAEEVKAGTTTQLSVEMPKHFKLPAGYTIKPVLSHSQPVSSF